LPALDSCHFQVVRALRKDHWKVTDKPKYIDDSDSEMFVYIDIEAVQETNGGETSPRQIYIEVKCFPGKNSTQEIYISLGQYLIYRALLARQEIRAPLYLAIPHTVYESAFNMVFRQALQDNRIMVVVVDLESETIVQWIE
jgi:hypothetical protein